MRSMSTKAGVARPVRRPRSSSRKTLTAFSMRSSASKRISSLVIIASPSLTHQRANLMPGDGPFDVALPLKVEHQDRQPGHPAQVDGGHVHHAQIIPNHLAVRQLLIAVAV